MDELIRFNMLCALIVRMFRIHPEQWMTGADLSNVLLEVFKASTWRSLLSGQNAHAGLWNTFMELSLDQVGTRLSKTEELLKLLGVAVDYCYSEQTSKERDAAQLSIYLTYLRALRDEANHALHKAKMFGEREDKLYPFASTVYPTVSAKW